jgi:riboflavin transporter FmnP
MEGFLFNDKGKTDSFLSDRKRGEMKKKNRTKKLVVTGMLGTIAFLLMMLNLPVFTDFLKLDIGDIPALVGAFAYGPVVGIVVEIMKNMLDYLFKGSTTGIPIGHLANLTAGLLYVLPIYFVYKKFPSKTGLVIACLTGILLTTTFMSIFNYYYFLPLYAKYLNLNPESFGQMFEYIIKIIVPFNVLKGTVNSLVFFMIHPKLKKWFK